MVTCCAVLLKTANKKLLYTLVFFLCVRCQCVEGYRGRLCEVDVDECDPNPCVNGASCLDGLGSYTCRCLPGFNGTRCETGTIGQMAHHHGNSRRRRTGKDIIHVKCFSCQLHLTVSVRVMGIHWLTPDSLLSLASSSGQVVKMMDGEFHATIKKNIK